MATSYGTTDPNVLTDREVEVLRYFAQGHTAQEIAILIERSASTVRSHLENVRAKLGARNVAHAIALGYAAGYLKDGA